MGEGESILRIGGIAGLLAGVVLVAAFILGAVGGVPFGADLEEQLVRFPDYGASFQLVNALSLTAAIIALALILALYRSLKETSPEYALAGVLLLLVFVGFYGVFTSWTFFVHPLLAGLHAAGTSAEQVTVVQTFAVTHAITDTIAFVGSLFFALSALAFGAVMLRNRDYGRLYGGVSLVLGIVGIALLALRIGAGPVLLIVFALVFGWRAYSLSKAA